MFFRCLDIHVFDFQIKVLCKYFDNFGFETDLATF
jgi:hypothetical protein